MNSTFNEYTIIALLIIIVCLMVYIAIITYKFRIAKNLTNLVTAKESKGQVHVTGEKGTATERSLVEDEYIKSVIDKLLTYDNTLAREQVVDFIKNIHKINATKLTIDKLYIDSIINFFFKNEKEHKTFLHYTAEEEIAQKILDTGFWFLDSFSQTAKELSKDIVVFSFNHNQRKYYGKYIVVISISKKLYEYYLNEYKKIKNTQIDVEHILTDQSVTMNEDSEQVTVIPTQFVKGYVNYETGEIVNNPNFTPTYNPDKFKQNLKELDKRG